MLFFSLMLRERERTRATCLENSSLFDVFEMGGEMIILGYLFDISNKVKVGLMLRIVKGRRRQQVAICIYVTL